MFVENATSCITIDEWAIYLKEFEPFYSDIVISDIDNTK